MKYYKKRPNFFRIWSFLHGYRKLKKITKKIPDIEGKEKIIKYKGKNIKKEIIYDRCIFYFIRWKKSK